MTPDQDAPHKINPDRSKHGIFSNFQEAYDSNHPIVTTIFETFVSQVNKPVQAELTLFRPLTKTWVDRGENGAIYKIEDSGLKEQFDNMFIHNKQEMIFLLTGLQVDAGMTKIKIAGSRQSSHQMLMGSMLEAGIDHASLVQIIKGGVDLSGGQDNLYAYSGALLTPESNIEEFDSFCDVNAYMDFPFKQRRLIKIVYERMQIMRESLARMMDEASVELNITQLKKPKIITTVRDRETRTLINLDEDSLLMR